MIVGFGQDPNHPIFECGNRALFWEDATEDPVALPFLMVDNEPYQEDFMFAYDIRDPRGDGSIEDVGSSGVLHVAVLWLRMNGNWEAIDLNTVIDCGASNWANVKSAHAINSCGWIAGAGTLSDNSERAYVLIPADYCPGDMVGAQVSYPDGKVNVSDLLYVINSWATSNCIADVNGDAAVDVIDLLAVINGWGPCSCFPAQGSVKALSQEVTDAGLTSAKWNNYLDVMTNGSQSDKENYNCWMTNYLTGCTICPACPGRNPFANWFCRQPRHCWPGCFSLKGVEDVRPGHYMSLGDFSSDCCARTGCGIHRPRGLAEQSG